MLVSAAIAGGPPRRLLRLARAGEIELVIADLVIEELVRVLGGKRGWERSRLRAFVATLEATASLQAAAPTVADPRSGDPDDDRILACAVAARVDVIASGNRRHMLPLGAVEGIRILTPQALLAELRHAT